MGWFFPILGSLFLVFRVWLCEKKVKPQLEFRSRYISRILTYYYCIAMMLNFTSEVLDLMVAMSVPMMTVIFVVFDLQFIIKFSRKNKPIQVENVRWLVIERWTLHPPLIITGIYWWIVGLKDNVFVPAPHWTSFIIALALLLGPFFLLDVRWTEKYEAPEGALMAVFSCVSVLGMAVYFFLP